MVDNNTTFVPSTAELIQKGQKYYEEELKTKLEKKYLGKFVAIEVGSGKYFIGDTLEEALEKAKKKFPDKIFHSIKIGSPGIFTSSGVDFLRRAKVKLEVNPATDTTKLV